ncbi:phosphatidate cytidylyltransferase [Microbacterium bovistercoris]|uniref:Phosphatidate cytidylyltransferase n=1 Tax=Microbacterium bovistercoris TaxID=2293570 RepID=A0A371NRJ9_9MICO|nr:phosphatidate cytidylyltransferase [Microbacterium bovistercoris]REJ04761.1 phosphatidate cytidylyltransferase [Microbacterium bovistercoris]
MSDDSSSQDRPLTRREARAAAATPAQGTPQADAADTVTPVRGVPVAGAPAEKLAAPAVPTNPARPEPEAVPLDDAAFPGFDAAAVPPRPSAPEVPAAQDRPQADAGDGSPPAAEDSRPPVAEGGAFSTADHSAIRDQWRAARDELGTHVSHARDQFDQANERIKQRTGRDLIVAILIGVAFGAVLLASLLFVKWLFVPIALAAGLLGTYEVSRALKGGGRRIDIVPQLIAAALLIPTGYFDSSWLSWVMLFVSVTFVCVWRMIAQMAAGDGRTYGDVLADVLVSGFVQVYVPLLTTFALMLLRQDHGEWWVLSFIVVAVVADTAAYAAGLSFGKHPMAPRISPKKTWEGFAGAVAGSLLAGALLGVFLLQIPLWGGLVLGAAILASATLGDLGESMLKRDLGIKDMSSWLPGHGGLLDRLDSILPSTVPAYALYVLLSPWMVS